MRLRRGRRDRAERPHARHVAPSRSRDARTPRPRTQACARTGATLVASLVALVLAGAAAVLVARAATLAIAVQGRLVVAERAHDDHADALDAIAARLRDVEPAAGDLLEASPSALAYRGTVGVALLCAQRADTLVLARGADDAPWAGAWQRDPAVGDLVRPLAADTLAPVVRAVRPASGACASAVRGWGERATWELVLAGTLPALAPGSGVRLLARERWHGYDGAGRVRTLGFATWDAGGGAWAAPQPVVAPLAPAAERGLAVVAHDAGGRVLAAGALASAARVTVVVRAGGTADADSIVVPFHAP
jgi:hypothetical protein